MDNGPAEDRNCDGRWICVAPYATSWGVECGVSVRDPCETAKCHVD